MGEMSGANVWRDGNPHRHSKSRLPVRTSGSRRKPGRRLALLLAIAFPLAGCTHVTVGEGGGEEIVGIGLVRIELPRTQGSLLAIGRSGVGIGWDGLPGGGAWLGYSGGQWVIADPAECQLLVIIRSPAEAENAARVLAALAGGSPCIVDHTGTLRP